MHMEVLGETLAPDGTILRLTRRDTEYIILANGKSLMSSRMHGSEEALATFACQRLHKLEEPCVLIGGLGMGFTLRATLDLLPPDATVVVAEMVPAVVEWNRGPLGPFAEHPLKDKRVRIEIGDVAATLKVRTRKLPPCRSARCVKWSNRVYLFRQCGQPRIAESRPLARLSR